MLLDHAKMKHIFKSISMLNAGIVERDGLTGLYRGFVPNALKNLPNSRYILLHTMVTKNIWFSFSKTENDFFFCLTTHVNAQYSVIVVTMQH